ncbi:MAG: DedA family protein [Paludibacteraceae bacterium]|nr:DedA family protein [Paludibacteraceae bacterium]MBR6104900.1 DedA family protein [Paludibacteraceae bacterium]
MELIYIQETVSQFYAGMSGVLMEGGYLGVFVGTMLATSFVPFPSSVLFVFFITEAHLNPLFTILCASAGNTCGSLVFFYIGRLGKLRWLCTYARIKPRKIRRFVKTAQKWGPPLAFLSFLPGFGQTVSVALGLLRCDVLKTSTFIFLGKVVRYLVFTLVTFGVIRWFS